MLHYRVFIVHDMYYLVMLCEETHYAYKIPLVFVFFPFYHKRSYNESCFEIDDAR